MDRRRFLLTSLAGALAVPLGAAAQQKGKVYRIGYLSFAPGTGVGVFRDGLRELGYVEGKNLVIEYRSAQPDPARLSALAAELVAASVDVIVAIYNPAIIAAKTATTTIPIVGLIVLEPVETGIVQSLARPGGNVTGLSWEEGTEQVAKTRDLQGASPESVSYGRSMESHRAGACSLLDPVSDCSDDPWHAVYSVEYSRD
jgi:ABC-type uncharacterized transport system substrate-binding protein